MADLKLTVGMAVYEDFANLWSTITALRMYHPEVLPALEIIVVDNNPGSPEGERCRDFIAQWVAATPELGGAVYIPLAEPVGTAAPRNRVFAEASAPAVLVMDSHVMIEPEGLRRLIEFYDESPETMDLFGGALIYDDLKHVSTHFEDEWRAEMWGTWGTDPRYEFERKVAVTRAEDGSVAVAVERREGPPFEVPGMGLGLFTCRREAWVGFHPEMRGFGGEEMYIHEKFRQAGHKCWCLPWLRWAHQFGRPGGVPYPLAAEDKFRNYILGLSELGFDLSPAIEHFTGNLTAERIDKILLDLGQSRAAAGEYRQLTYVQPAAAGGLPAIPEDQQQQVVGALFEQLQRVGAEAVEMKEERDKALAALADLQRGGGG
jgi:hypothetical protein